MKQADVRCMIAGWYLIADKVVRKKDRTEVTHCWRGISEYQQDMCGLRGQPGKLGAVTPRGRLLAQDLGVLEDIMYAPYDFYTVFVFRDD